MDNVNYSINTSSPQNQYLCKEWSSTIEENNNTKNHIAVNSDVNENQSSIMFQSNRSDREQQSFEALSINAQPNPNYQHQLSFYDNNYCYNQQQVSYQHQSNFQYHDNTSAYDNQKLSNSRNTSPIYSQQPGRNSDSSSGSSTSDNRLMDSKQQQSQQQQRSNEMIINNNVFSNDSDITSTVSGNNLLRQSEILDLDSHKVHQVFQGNNDSNNSDVTNSKHNWSNYMPRDNFQNNDYNPNYIPNETFVKNVSTTVPVPNVSPTSSSSNIRSIKKSTTKWRSNEPRRPKSYLCKACDKWFTSSGHLERHYNTTLHKNAVTNSNEPDPATLPVSAHYHPERAQQHLQQQQLQQQQASVAQITDQNISPTNQVPNVKCIDNEDDYERSKSCATTVQLATLRPMIPIETPSIYGYQQQQQQQQGQSLPVISTQTQQPPPQQQESQQQTQQRQTQDHSPHQQQSIVEILNAQNEVQHFQTLASNSLNFPSNYPNELAPHVIQTTNTTNNNSIIQTATAMNNSNINTTGTSNLQTATTGDYILTTAPQAFQINATHFLVPQQQTLPSFEQLQNHRYGYVEFPNIKVEPSSPELDNVGGPDSVTNPHFESNNHLVQHQSTNHQTIGDNTFIIATDFASNKENIQLLIKASDTDLNTENYSLCYFDNTNQLYINVPDSSSHTYQSSSNTATNATSTAVATATTTTTLMHSPPTSTIVSPNNNSQARAIDPIKRRKTTNRPIIKREVFDDSEGLISSTGSPSEVPMISSNDGDSNNLEPDKPFCKICNKVFNKVCYYTQHNRSFHDGNKPYKCEKCGKKFKKEDLFNIHVKKHDGNKPHKCRLCPKQFNHKTDLSRHYYLHSGKKPYSCDKCGKGFIRRDHMLKHRETHTRRNQVIRCQQNMVKKPALISKN